MIFIQHYDSPLGAILLAADETGLTGLWFNGQKFFARDLPEERVEQNTPTLSEVKRWLDIYFTGKEPDFMPPLHPIGSAFRRSVWDILLRIPYGQTTTYGEIARQLAEKQGRPRIAAQAQQLRALVALVQGRVVEEAELLPVPCRLQGRFQPAGLAGQHLFVVCAGIVQLVEPAPRAAEGQVTVKQAVVMEYLQRGQAVLVEEPLHLGGRLPPVVVIALEENLFAGKPVDELKVRQGLLEAHAPAQVAAEDGDVILRQRRKAAAELFHVVLPFVAEDVHGLIGAERQVQVAKGVEGHRRASFLW